MLRRQLLTGLLVTISLIVLTGVAYPLAVWGVGRLAFPGRADGGFVTINGRVVGSAEIGQRFTGPDGTPLAQYFQSRPSAAGTSGYDPTSSGASNLGPSSVALIGNRPGINTDGPTNPFATPNDPACVPVPATDAQGQPLADAQHRPVYVKEPDGQYRCDPTTVPERIIAYRRLNGLPLGAAVPVDAVTASGSGLDPDISEANALDQAPRIAKVRHRPADAIVALVRDHTSARIWGFLGERTVNVLNLNLALDRLYPMTR